MNITLIQKSKLEGMNKALETYKKLTKEDWDLINELLIENENLRYIIQQLKKEVEEAHRIAGKNHDIACQIDASRRAKVEECRQLQMQAMMMEDGNEIIS